MDTLEEFQQVLQLPNLIVLKIFADWCGPCHAYKPQFEQLANAVGDDVLFIDAPQEKNFIKVEGLPTTFFIKNNQIVDKIVGIDMPLLQQKVSQYR